jgi:hypothetical protein
MGRENKRKESREKGREITSRWKSEEIQRTEKR